MTRISTVAVALSCVALVAGCGGGGSSGGAVGSTATSGGTVTTPVSSPTPGTPPATATYQTLSSTAVATSTLEGVAFRSDGTTTGTDIVSTPGTLAHASGRTELSVGSYQFVDPDGVDSNGRLSNGSSTLQQVATAGTYEYVAVYDHSYVDNGTAYDTVGVLGVATRAADMPTAGGTAQATYTGDAAALVVTGSDQYEMTGGVSNVSANFGSGTVDVTMNGFGATRHTGAGSAVAPIDTISVTGMTIAGNEFSGGTVTTSNGGAGVAITGAGTTSAAQGNFYGYDAAIAAPDEVGGAVLQRGSSGLVYGGFVAD